MPTLRRSWLPVLFALATGCARQPAVPASSPALLDASSASHEPTGAAPAATLSSTAPPGPAQGTSTPPRNAASPVLLKVARLIDGVSAVPKENQAILVVDGRVRAVGAAAAVAKDVPAGTKVIELGSATALPGLIDAHTHVLLQGDITAADYDAQLLKESIAYRAIRATAAARTALTNGFTAIRDLETEGAMYADVDVKLAIERGVIPGPRMFVSTRALAPTGMYPLTGYSWELRMPEGVQIADGPDALRKAVREQVK